MAIILPYGRWVEISQTLFLSHTQHISTSIQFGTPFVMPGVTDN